MKKALLASLIAYLALLVAVVTMMIVYVAMGDNAYKPLFISISVVFGVFVLVFVLIIILLVLYPKKLSKEYKEKLAPIIEEHGKKYGEKHGRIVVSNKENTVFVSFIMDEANDTYTFELKEKPLTKSEASRIAFNAIGELYGQTVCF